jgi:hypothetical protein
MIKCKAIYAKIPPYKFALNKPAITPASIDVNVLIRYIICEFYATCFKFISPIQ